METETLLKERYRLGARVGSGGMADVHRATDLLLERDVAVKLLRGSDADRERFASEGCTVAALNHPGIVTVLDAGLDADPPYLVMELVDGPTLAHEMSEGPLDPGRVQAIGEQVAAALAHAHAQGIVHRDVKPGNVLIRPDGTACLADFGIACLVDGSAAATDTGQVVGSPAYVAPEQVALEDVGPPADVYALGLVLLEALTGRRAFQGTGVEVAYARMRSGPEIPVSLGPPWVTALAAMTSRSPADRPSAAEVVELLAGPAAVTSEVATAAFSAAPAVAGSALPVRRRRAAFAALAGTAALVATLVLVGFADGTDRSSGVPPTEPSTSPAARQVPSASRSASASPGPVVASTRRRHRAGHHAHHVHRHVRHAAHHPAGQAHGKGHGKGRHKGHGHH